MTPAQRERQRATRAGLLSVLVAALAVYGGIGLLAALSLGWFA